MVKDKTFHSDDESMIPGQIQPAEIHHEKRAKGGCRKIALAYKIVETLRCQRGHKGRHPQSFSP
jgi:hypothetical protein